MEDAAVVLSPDERVFKFNRIIASYAGLIYAHAFAARSIFDTKNVAHIMQAIHNTKHKQQIKLGKLDLNPAEERCIASMNELLSFCSKGNTDRIPPLVNIDLIRSLFSRSTDVTASTATLSSITFILAVVNQCAYQENSVVLPKVFIFTSHSGKDFIGMHPNSANNFGCNLPVTNEGLWLNRAWSRMYSGIVLPSGQSNRNAIIDLFRACYIPTLPSATNGIGLSTMPIDAITSSHNTGRPLYHYIDTSIIQALRTNNRIVPTLDELVSHLTAQTAKIAQHALEADTDELDTEDDPADEAPADDDPSLGGDNDDPSPDDNDDPSADGGDPQDDETGDDPDEDNPDTDNPTNDTQGDEEAEPEHVELLKLDLELAKDETLDDLLYKISVAKYITELKKQGRVSGNKLKALMGWKHKFLFLVSAKETKKFLTHLKQQNIN